MRHDRIAHPTNSELKYNSDVEELYKSINEIGFNRIVEEFKVYGKECVDIINNLAG